VAILDHDPGGHLPEAVRRAGDEDACHSAILAEAGGRDPTRMAVFGNSRHTAAAVVGFFGPTTRNFAMSHPTGVPTGVLPREISRLIVRYRTYSNEATSASSRSDWPSVALWTSGRNKACPNASSDQGGVGFPVLPSRHLPYVVR
jgi:hypothetical protein